MSRLGVLGNAGLSDRDPGLINSADGNAILEKFLNDDAPIVKAGNFTVSIDDWVETSVSSKAPPFCCASTAFLSKTVPFLAVYLPFSTRASPG
eukprot:SAG22_NODE_2784_length_2212_cov_2.925225_7_plen_93_part_00